MYCGWNGHLINVHFMSNDVISKVIVNWELQCLSKFPGTTANETVFYLSSVHSHSKSQVPNTVSPYVPSLNSEERSQDVRFPAKKKDAMK